MGFIKLKSRHKLREVKFMRRKIKVRVVVVEVEWNKRTEERNLRGCNCGRGSCGT